MRCGSRASRRMHTGGSCAAGAREVFTAHEALERHVIGRKVGADAIVEHEDLSWEACRRR
eukprot:4006625-Prymnesium_polylepis.2